VLRSVVRTTRNEEEGLSAQTGRGTVRTGPERLEIHENSREAGLKGSPTQNDPPREIAENFAPSKSRKEMFNASDDAVVSNNDKWKEELSEGQSSLWTGRFFPGVQYVQGGKTQRENADRMTNKKDSHRFKYATVLGRFLWKV